MTPRKKKIIIITSVIIICTILWYVFSRNTEKNVLGQNGNIGTLFPFTGTTGGDYQVEQNSPERVVYDQNGNPISGTSGLTVGGGNGNGQSNRGSSNQNNRNYNSNPFDVGTISILNSNDLSINKKNIFGGGDNCLDGECNKGIRTLTLKVNGEIETGVTIGNSYSDEGAYAYDTVDGDISTWVTTAIAKETPYASSNYIGIGTSTSLINTNATSTYIITYSVTSTGPTSEPNHREATRIVHVCATCGDGLHNALTLDLLGDNPAGVNIGTTYRDAGAHATDALDPSVTDNDITFIVSKSSAFGRYDFADIGHPVTLGDIGSLVDTSASSTYMVTYSVHDTLTPPLTAIKHRIINVCATCGNNGSGPVITVLGDNPAGVRIGAIYTEAGATVDDPEDPSLTTDAITYKVAKATVYGGHTFGTSTDTMLVGISGLINTSASSTYRIQYSVTDAMGQNDTAYRIVNVCATCGNNGDNNNNGPVITVLGDDPIGVNTGTLYIDDGATVTDPEQPTLSTSTMKYYVSKATTYHGTDFGVETLTPFNQIKNAVITTATSTYRITYYIKDDFEQLDIKYRIVNVCHGCGDSKQPTITLNGDELSCSIPGTRYRELGATVDDPTDNPVSPSRINIRYLKITSSSGGNSGESILEGLFGSFWPSSTPPTTPEPNTSEKSSSLIERLFGSFWPSTTTPSSTTTSGITTTTTGATTSTGSTYTEVSSIGMLDSVSTYLAIYSFTDSIGESALEIRTISASGRSPCPAPPSNGSPVLSVIGENPNGTNIGAPYIDSGATVEDLGDLTIGNSDITASVSKLDTDSSSATFNTYVLQGTATTTGTSTTVFADISRLINTSATSTYLITYHVVDHQTPAQSDQKTRLVNVCATCGSSPLNAPVVTLNGSANFCIEPGTRYNEPGAKVDSINDNLSEAPMNPATGATRGMPPTAISSITYFQQVETTVVTSSSTVVESTSLLQKILNFFTSSSESSSTVTGSSTATSTTIITASSTNSYSYENIRTIDVVNDNDLYLAKYTYTDSFGYEGTQFRLVAAKGNSNCHETRPVTTSVEIDLAGRNPDGADIGTTYRDPGASAFYNDGVSSTPEDITSYMNPIRVLKETYVGTSTTPSYLLVGTSTSPGPIATSILDTSATSTYKIIYSVDYPKTSTSTHYEASRTVNVCRTCGGGEYTPVITIRGEAQMQLDEGAAWTEPGYEAWDTDVTTGENKINISDKVTKSYFKLTFIPAPATPVAYPISGTYDVPQSVSLTSSTSTHASETNIFYTTDGTDPVCPDTGISIASAGTVYTYEIPVIANGTTLKAIACGKGGSSDIASFAYNITYSRYMPVASPTTGSFDDSRYVIVSLGESSTTPTTVPSAGTAPGTAPHFPMAPKKSLFASVLDFLMPENAHAEVSDTEGTPKNGSTQNEGGTTKTKTDDDSFVPEGEHSIHYVVSNSDIDATNPTCSSTLYINPIQLSLTNNTFNTEQTINLRAITCIGTYKSPISSFTYTIKKNLNSPKASPMAGDYNGTQYITLLNNNTGVYTKSNSPSVHYTTNGTTPSCASTAYTKPITASEPSGFDLKLQNNNVEKAGKNQNNGSSLAPKKSLFASVLDFLMPEKVRAAQSTGTGSGTPSDPTPDPTHGGGDDPTVNTGTDITNVGGSSLDTGTGSGTKKGPGDKTVTTTDSNDNIAISPIVITTTYKTTNIKAVTCVGGKASEPTTFTYNIYPKSKTNLDNLLDILNIKNTSKNNVEYKENSTEINGNMVIPAAPSTSFFASIHNLLKTNIVHAQSGTSSGATGTSVRVGTGSSALGGALRARHPVYEWIPVDKIETNLPASYMVHYDATDSYGSVAATVGRQVDICHCSANPVVKLVGTSTVILKIGTPYQELGATIIESKGYTDDVLHTAYKKRFTVNVVGTKTTAPTVPIAGSNGMTPVFPYISSHMMLASVLDFLLPNTANAFELSTGILNGGTGSLSAETGDYTYTDVTSISTTVNGTYVAIYTATNKDGESSEPVVRTIDVIGSPVDPHILPPEVLLNGEAKNTVFSVNDFMDEGATAVDPKDGDISAKIQVQYFFNPAPLTPTVDVTPGDVTKPTTIHLASSGADTIYYTRDGAYPVCGSNAANVFTYIPKKKSNKYDKNTVTKNDATVTVQNEANGGTPPSPKPKTIESTNTIAEESGDLTIIERNVLTDTSSSITVTSTLIKAVGCNTNGASPLAKLRYNYTPYPENVVANPDSSSIGTSTVVVTLESPESYYILYSVDGTTIPSCIATSTESIAKTKNYQYPISVHAPMTIKAVGCNGVGQSPNVKSFNYSI